MNDLLKINNLTRTYGIPVKIYSAERDGRLTRYCDPELV